MINILNQYNINLTSEKLEKLNIFKELLKFYNDKFNLTSIKEDKEIIIKHFLDSLYGEKFFNLNKTVVEVGSGGGFPSIPLMIYRDDLVFTLIESTGKKCEYLKTVIKELNLKGEVYCLRAEDAGKDSKFRHNFDYVTARAVAKMNTLCEYCIPLIKVGGSFIAYKGESDIELIEASNAIKVLGGKVKNIEKYNLPDDMGTRHIFEVLKVNETPLKYPRGNGKERSKPL